MRISLPHYTTKEKARGIVEKKLVSLLSQFGGHAEEVQHEWFGDTMTFKGKARGLKVHGTLEVTDAAVILDSKLPMIALPFEGKIRQAVEKEAESLFRTA